MIENASDIQARLLGWYDTSRRQLPWRAGPGETADPYRVWLSEIMLQQTVVATVIPYFKRFVARWPDIDSLAAAPLDDVLTEWAGLGYYARARNLHACALVVSRDHGGVFPSQPALLLTLPGIGAYTAGAIAAIAFDLPFAAVDGNVERVTARLANVETPLPQARPELRRLAESLVPRRRAGDFAQALMDLGATICIPASPRCTACPLAVDCAALRAGNAARLPLKTAKRPKPTRYGRVFWAVDDAGAVLVRRRAESGLLGGMIEFPSSEWAGLESLPTARPPIEAKWRSVPGRVKHNFTHFHLELEMVAATLDVAAPDVDGTWVSPDHFDRIALPSVMRKVAEHAASHCRNPALELEGPLEIL